MREALLVFLVWNLIVLLIYAQDKFRARKKLRRTSEKTLVATAFLLGGIGALFAMVIFNHKTSKMKFRILIPLAAVFSGVFLWFAAAL